MNARGRELFMAKIQPDSKLLLGITKERFVVSQIWKWLPEYPLIILSGPRQGLRQLVLNGIVMS